MFDTIKTLAMAFAGKLKHLKEGRKVVWILLITFLAGWVSALFMGWISYPSYYSMIQYLPFANQLGWAFTVSIAGFIYFSMAYVAGYWVEVWKKVDSSKRNYTRLGVRLIGFGAVIFLICDFLMNLTGATYRADEAAGNISLYEYETPAQTHAAISSAQAKLSELEGGKVGGYGWRDPKTGIFWLNQSGKKAAADLRATIRRTQQADSTSRAQHIANQQTLNNQREQVYQKAHRTLKGGVYFMPLIMFILCLIQGFCVESIQSENERPQRPVQQRATAGYTQVTNNNQTSNVGQNNGHTVNNSSGYHITCKHCGKDAVMSSARAVFCSDTCRVASYQEKKGIELKRIPDEIKPIGYK